VDEAREIMCEHISNICPLWNENMHVMGIVALRDLEQTASDEITEAQEFKASKGDEAKKE
jgi:CBS-domain-containing membrane protein